MSGSLTKAEKLLLAAMELEQSGIRPFSAEDLVVAAWKVDPDAFGLEGYPQYPDSNRVYTEIMGSKPLRDRGWLLKTGVKLYQLSDAGRIVVQNLMRQERSETGSRADLSRDQKRLIRKLLSSKAAAKARSDATDTIVFSDACAFWDISPRSVGSRLRARLQSVEAVLEVAQEVVREKGGLTLTHESEPVTAEDTQLLRDTHDLLKEKFAEELEVIRARTDERLTR